MADGIVAKNCNERNIDIRDVHDNMSRMGAKLDLLADVNYDDISFGGMDGAKYLLREMADDLRKHADDVWNFRNQDHSLGGGPHD